MSNDIKDKDMFGFYIPFHNEDAEPFFREEENFGLKSGLLVVADGLGGSGGTVHRLDPECYKTIDADLRAAFLPELAELEAPKEGETEQKTKPPAWLKQYKEWVDKMLEPMIDATPDTSALWASRIVIARFVFYVLSYNNKFIQDNDVIQDVENFINKGLTATKTKFDLRAGALSGQSVLPTTLVAIQYRQTRKGSDSVSINVFWAGDSRAYAMIPGKGLRQLSKDDEDASGSINKLFGFKGNSDQPRVPHSNMTSYRFEMPFAMFVCSDGLFDPFAPIDNVGVENAFIQALETATTFDEYKANLYKYYEPIEQDDRSIAFVHLGFESFDAFKQAFITRKDEVAELYGKYQRYKNYFSVVLNEDEDDPVTVIRNRAEKRKSEILQVVAEATVAKANGEGDDPIVSEELLVLYRGANEIAIKKAEERKEKAAAEAVVAIRDALRRGEPIFKEVPTGKAWQKVQSAKDELDKAQAAYNKAAQAYDSAKQQLEKNKQSEIDLLAEINEEISRENAKLDRKRTEKKDYLDYKAAYEKAVDALNALNEAEKAWSALGGSCDVDKADVSRLYKSRAEQFGKAAANREAEVGIIGKLLANLQKLKSCLENRQEPGWQLCSDLKGNPLLADVKGTISGVKEYEKSVESAKKEEEKTSEVLKKRQSDYKAAVEQVSDTEVLALVNQPEAYLSSTYCQSFGLPLRATEKPLAVTEFNEVLNEHYAGAAAFAKLIDAFIALPAPSVVDKWFNATQLRTCRGFAGIDREDVKKVWKRVQEVLIAYEEYLQ